MKIVLRVVFQGLVQGVGFRRTVLKRAQEFHLFGTVKNLEDGSVEVCIQGENNICKNFIISLQNNSGFAKIEKINIKKLENSNFIYNNFIII